MNARFRMLRELTEARRAPIRPKPSRVNVALGDAAMEAAGKAALRSNRVARIIRSIHRRRWRAFIASDPFNPELLVRGLDDEIRAAIAGELMATARETARVNLNAIARTVPVEALLLVNRKFQALATIALPKAVKESALDYEEPLNDNTTATATANALVKLPTEAATAALVNEPFQGKSWQDRLKNWIPVESDLAREITNGITQGKSRSEIAAAILPLVNNNAVAAERIARTEVHRVNVTAQMRSIDQALGPAIIGWRYTATLDDRTSNEHAALDGTIYPRGAEKPRLPSRPNCRCVYTPEMAPYADLGVPASMAAVLEAPFGGRAAQVYSKISKQMEGTGLASTARYPDWFAAQPVAKQSEILGQRLFDQVRRKNGKAEWSAAVTARGIAPKAPPKFDAPDPQPFLLTPIQGSKPDPEIPKFTIPGEPGVVPDGGETIPAPPAGFIPTPPKPRKRRIPRR